jgi:ABC-type multidrug transport system fused ATPase/permease subunit
MNTYLRMLKMVKPYTTQLVLALVFMIIFSFMSIFSITMISPFLQALFLEDEPTAQVADDQVAAEQSGDSAIIVQDEAGVPHESHSARSQELADRQPPVKAKETEDESRARYEDLKESFSGLDSVKLEFRRWADETLLKGSKQEALLRICLVFFGMALLKNPW